MKERGREDLEGVKDRGREVGNKRKLLPQVPTIVKHGHGVDIYLTITVIRLDPSAWLRFLSFRPIVLAG
jgi:hypothetical protein